MSPLYSKKPSEEENSEKAEESAGLDDSDEELTKNLKQSKNYESSNARAGTS